LDKLAIKKLEIDGNVVFVNTIEIIEKYYIVLGKLGDLLLGLLFGGNFFSFVVDQLLLFGDAELGL
jgi:hypothetical protein